MDIQWNDARLLSTFYQAFTGTNDPESCKSALQANLDFNNKIYQEGLKIEKYEDINKFTPYLLLEKKRYALLQMQFWINSINLKKSCNATYTNLVYFYSHDEGLSVKQKVQSAILLDAKKKCGAELMLIPLPFDLDITAVNMIKSNFKINSTPSILIDEKVVLEDVQAEAVLRNYVPCLK
jgi:hypothetical protein